MMNSAVKQPFISSLVEGQLDQQVYQDILKTYAKETITLLNYGNTSITTVPDQTIARVQFTECEISPFHKHELDCVATEEAAFSRQASTPRFSPQKMAFTTLQNLLIHAFSPDEAGHRPYPSGGGLYAIEPLVFLFPERIEHSNPLISGCYHFRPISKKLQLLQKMSADHFFNTLLHGLIKPTCRPTVGILYLAHVGKAIFKYRYRGYRHALMEVGSMYQQATCVAQQMNLRTTVWSTFSDYQMLYELELDYGTYLPLTMQFFGYGEPV